jgi:HD-GYP domain-containing protein (c-di-GMP phosphodiesterase class II)
MIPANEIEPGMFVSALDRPWVDTPFPLQGFVVASDEDVAELRRYCRHVYIDATKSVGTRFEHERSLARKAAQEEVAAERQRIVQVRRDETARVVVTAAAGASAAPPIRAEPVRAGARAAGRMRAPARTFAGRMMPISREESALLGSLAPAGPPLAVADAADAGATPLRRAPLGAGFGLGWVRSLVDRLRGERYDDARHCDAPADRAPDSLGASPIIVYEDQATIVEEMPRAEKTMERAQETLKQIVSDVESKGTVRIEKAEEVVGELVESMVRNPNALMWLARLRHQDARAYSHSLEAAIYMVSVGLQLGLDRAELSQMSTAGLMLDVGKLRVPVELLERPGKLSESEFAAVKRHVDYSLEILIGSEGVDARVIEAVARHHEREDGSGYPYGLKDETIGFYGRLAGIVDTYVAVTNPRPYAGTLSPHDGVRALYQWKGTIFHEPLVEVLVQAIGVFPVGSMVELSSGEVAIVVAHNRVRRLKPRVLLVTGPDKSALSRPAPLDLLYAGDARGAEELTITRSLAPGAFGIDPREYYVQ